MHAQNDARETGGWGDGGIVTFVGQRHGPRPHGERGGDDDEWREGAREMRWKGWVGFSEGEQPEGCGE